MKIRPILPVIAAALVVAVSLSGCSRTSSTATAPAASATTTAAPSSSAAAGSSGSSSDVSSSDASSSETSSSVASSSAAPGSDVSSSDASSSAASGDGGSVVVGVDQPRSDTDFWSAFAKYVPEKAKLVGVTLQNTASDNDAAKLKTNVDTLLSKGVKALVLAPQDTAAVAPALSAADKAGVPVVTVDTRPDAGKVFMVVRADNRAYGTNACIVLGETLKNTGTVVEFQGDLASINGRDRSEAFAACMKEKYSGIKVVEVATEWKGDKAVSGLQDALVKGAVNGIYMQAGGAFLEPTLALLKRSNKLKPVGDAAHIAIVSNDGIKAELDAIGRGDIDATVSQPADAYAQWALFYAKAAAAGKTFPEGATDHKSTIIKTPGGMLEDQLPAPVVTKSGDKLGSLVTVKFDSKDLWGNGS